MSFFNFNFTPVFLPQHIPARVWQAAKMRPTALNTREHLSKYRPASNQGLVAPNCQCESCKGK